MSMKKKAVFGIGLAGLLAAAAGIFWAAKKRKAQHENNPPEGAPQLPIQNPGDQSEFPTAPEEERNLG